MRMRIFIYKPDEASSERLIPYIESVGHDAVMVQSPQACLQYHSAENICKRIEACADAIILGHDMPVNAGLDMIERRLAAGCQGAVHSAIICSGMAESERRRADQLGCRYFPEPLDLDEFGRWLDEVRQKIPEERVLSPFTIGGNVEEKLAEGL